jgi:hypothetical protein
MSDPSPYQPPLAHEPSLMPSPEITEPAAVRVMGILHLVFAGWGILTASWALYMAVAGNPFLKLSPAGAPLTDQMKAQISMQAKIQPASVTMAIFSLLVAIPMIIAGIRLLKKRRSALKWSNGYAYSSLTAKMVNVVMTVTIIVPAMREMTQGMFAGSHAPGQFEDVMGMMMGAGAVGSALLACIYPVLSLVLLNGSKAKVWFATRVG